MSYVPEGKSGCQVWLLDMEWWFPTADPMKSISPLELVSPYNL